jgi:hypothetical protein
MKTIYLLNETESKQVEHLLSVPGLDSLSFWEPSDEEGMAHYRAYDADLEEVGFWTLPIRVAAVVNNALNVRRRLSRMA